jgi:NAD(P)-dependent dehydrogenase (short-subunit alcohol dehydrogenase family)
LTEASAPARPRGGAALVTGGAKRIGRAICLELAAAGFDLAIHHRDSADEAAEVARAVEAMGRRAACLSADLADAEATGTLIGRAVEALGPERVIAATLPSTSGCVRCDSKASKLLPETDGHEQPRRSAYLLA